MPRSAETIRWISVLAWILSRCWICDAENIMRDWIFYIFYCQALLKQNIDCINKGSVATEFGCLDTGSLIRFE